jgi:hypothetical protein
LVALYLTVTNQHDGIFDVNTENIRGSK